MKGDGGKTALAAWFLERFVPAEKVSEGANCMMGDGWIISRFSLSSDRLVRCG